MKPRNFPARKLTRQLRAKGIDLESADAKRQLEVARAIRTKKVRGHRGGSQ